MSRTYKDSKKANGNSRERHISVRAVRRDPPDLRKLSRAIIQLAMEQAAAEAAAEAEANTKRTSNEPPASEAADD